MSLCSSFRDRVDQMERTRNEGISLLQAERELQERKTKVLSSKLENVRSMERRCFAVEAKLSSLRFKTSSLKSEIERLYTRHESVSVQLRAMKSEIEELEKIEKEKRKFYEVKQSEMEAFKENVEKFEADFRVQVIALRDRVNELKSTFKQLQGSSGAISNSAIAAAEMIKSGLLASNLKFDTMLASNKRIRSQLEKQVQHIFDVHEHPMGTEMRA